LAVIFTSVIIVSAGAWLTVSPLTETLEFLALPTLYWLLLAAILVCYVILTQLVKTWFIESLEHNGGPCVTKFVVI
jgi:Mg2+-importing ATPase